jgi:hypothetical protein
VPLTDQLDAEFMDPELVTYTPPSAPSEIGVERLSITLSPSCSGNIIGDDSSTCNGNAITFLPWTTDSWASGLSLTGFSNGVNVQANASQITISKVSIHRDQACTGNATECSAKPADIAISGYKVLVVDSGTKVSAPGSDSFPIVTQGLTPGPNAAVRHFAGGFTSSILDSSVQPHAHWAHGLLVDNSTVSVAFINRIDSGSGHGWSINSGVIWNTNGNYSIQNPPLGTNWGVGDYGGKRMNGLHGTPFNGTVVEEGTTILPVSLYEAQLTDRGQ